MELFKTIITVIVALVLLKLFIDIFMAGVVGTAVAAQKLGHGPRHHRGYAPHNRHYR